MDSTKQTDAEWASALLNKLVSDAELLAAVVLAWLAELEE